MPRARLTWYAESLIPFKLIRNMGDVERNKLIKSVERKLIDKDLAKMCINKLRKLDLIGEWLIELWYYEIFEDRKDDASGYNYEKHGINVWRAEWVTTAVPSSVLEKDKEIVNTSTSFKRIKVDNFELKVTAYFTITEED